jgi:hypothetical protein
LAHPHGSGRLNDIAMIGLEIEQQTSHRATKFVDAHRARRKH